MNTEQTSKNFLAEVCMRQVSWHSKYPELKFG